eukprot:CAMPEP_0182874544 /NCGR_PEP_ID=MMETSP0034_2-20130328/13004_1 /TAXON_ID=156128 /ORGANISM="Nephroselmis pyriformis, Strain CCMP717" /LENGTH=185 /DNA_ID=CAMNT_0025007259 /DNA_START=68 /DNA_END=622 /DNA_ORIENTATION=-
MVQSLLVGGWSVAGPMSGGLATSTYRGTQVAAPRAHVPGRPFGGVTPLTVCRSGREPASRVSAVSITADDFPQEPRRGSNVLLEIETRVTGAMEDAVRTSVETDMKEQAASSLEKPLKINRDLLLYRARQFRKEARLCGDNNKVRWKYLAQAEELFKQVNVMDPEDGRTYVGLGKLYEQSGRWDE